MGKMEADPELSKFLYQLHETEKEDLIRVRPGSFICLIPELECLLWKRDFSLAPGWLSWLSV